MRKTLLWQLPQVRIPLMLLLALLFALTFAGCGGGGGSSSNNNGNGGNNNGGGTPPNQNPTLAFISGRVVDNSSQQNGVANATVSVVGTNISARTASDGSFTLPNVPLNATQFTVTSPDTFVYYNFAQYTGKQYDTVACKLPLPTPLKAGANALNGTIQLFLGGQNPPPPPLINGCP